MQSFRRLSRRAKFAALGGAALSVYLCFVLGLFVASRLNPSSAAGSSVVAGGPNTGATATLTPPGAAPAAQGASQAVAATAPPAATASPLPNIPTPSVTIVAATATSAPSRTPTPVTPTATPQPTRTTTPTVTRPPTAEPGVPTATVAPERLIGARRSSQPSAKTGILVKISNAEGKPVRGVWASAAQQKADLNGNPIWGEEAANGRTDDAGTLMLPVPPGTYAMRIGDIAGDTWGDPFNFTVSPGNVTVLDINLARLLIGVTDADGKGVGGRYTVVRKQKKDLSGNPIRGDDVANGRTDDTGVKIYDLFSGIYSVGIGDIAGYPWGDEMSHALPAGETTSRIVSLGRLVVGVQDADKKALPGRYVAVRLQKNDLEGKPIKGDRVVDGRTSDTGLVGWDLTGGLYAVEIGDIAGAPWGEEMNHEVKGGATSKITVTLGRLTVGLKDSSGKAIPGRYAAVYLPKQDVTGSAIKGDRVAEGRTDDRGLLSFNLTPGEYIVDIENIGTLWQAPLVAGQTTFTDGATFR